METTMIPVKTIVLTAALSVGATVAIAQESGAGERSTSTYGYSGQSFDNNGPVISRRAPPRRRAPDSFYQGELGDSIGTTGTGYMNQEAR